MEAGEKRYLELLSRSFPTIAEASAEVINLSAILNLPKSTEFFASDIHGEFEAFSHILRNGSGSIRLKVDDVFGDTLTDAEKRALATLIYYPRGRRSLHYRRWRRVRMVRRHGAAPRRGLQACRAQSTRTPKSAAPCQASSPYIVEELLTEDKPWRRQGSLL